MASAILHNAAAGVFDEERLFEIVNGQRLEKKPMSAAATLLACELYYLLSNFVRERKLGAGAMEMLFQFATDRPQRRPDVAFVSFDRWPSSVIPVDEASAWGVVPNLAVEVLSPTNTAYEVVRKIREYFEAGVQLVWVVYPNERNIHVHESPDRSRVVHENQELDGGAVLSGLRISVKDVFACLVRPQ
jgi:Uma2 family endonuclease